MFESLRAVPADPILNLSVLYRQDTNPNKVDLGVGVYKDEAGHTAIMEAVSRAQEQILVEEDTKSYVGMAGSKRFCDLLSQITLGANHQVLTDQRVAIWKSLCATDVLRKELTVQIFRVTPFWILRTIGRVRTDRVFSINKKWEFYLFDRAVKSFGSVVAIVVNQNLSFAWKSRFNPMTIMLLEKHLIFFQSSSVCHRIAPTIF